MDEKHSSSRVVRAGGEVLTWIERVGLVVIAIATVVAGAQEVVDMIQERHVDLGDLLLLFIYLEVLAMVGIYLQSGALPIEMPLYIAMVALARHLILDMKEITETEMLVTSGAIVILATAVLVTRYGHVRFPLHATRSDEPTERR
jgi:protein PsiE